MGCWGVVGCCGVRILDEQVNRRTIREFFFGRIKAKRKDIYRTI